MQFFSLPPLHQGFVADNSENLFVSGSEVRRCDLEGTGKTQVALLHYFLTTFLQMVSSSWSAAKCIQGDWWEIRQSEKHSFPLIKLYVPDPRNYSYMCVYGEREKHVHLCIWNW